MWHNYWEFSKLWPRDSKYFQEKYCIYIWFYVGWHLSLERVSSGCVQEPSILWKLVHEPSALLEAVPGEKMVAWRVTRVTAVWSCIPVPQSSKPLGHWFFSVVLSFPPTCWYAWTELLGKLTPQVMKLVGSKSWDMFTFNQVHFTSLSFASV